MSSPPVDPIETLRALQASMQTHLGDVMHVGLSLKSAPPQAGGLNSSAGAGGLAELRGPLPPTSTNTGFRRANIGSRPNLASQAQLAPPAPTPSRPASSRITPRELTSQKHHLKHSDTSSPSHPSESPFNSTDLELQRRRLKHAPGIGARGSRGDLSIGGGAARGSRNDLRMAASRGLSGSRTLELLGGSGVSRSSGNLLKGVDESEERPSQAARDIEWQLARAQRRIDARLEKAEDNLFKTNESFYKAHTKTNLGSTYSVFNGTSVLDDLQSAIGGDLIVGIDDSAKQQDQDSSTMHILEPVKLPPISGSRRSSRPTTASQSSVSGGNGRAC
ncbi:hypothetical protein HK105_205917 [Polyrhizophydium stewartii]|uniref:Chromatin modification-related protein EAF6 n=1 Tax=Polyrhizophydium stewartii TaxID=2732419 RepID=A0ABR4N4Z8_9FUNG